MLDDLADRVLSLEKRLDNLVRVGVVVTSLPDQAKVRVQFQDVDKAISAPLPVLYQKTHKDKHYILPDVGEQVLCVFLPIGAELGFVLGAFYSKQDSVPTASQNIWTWQFSDGGSISYNRSNGSFAVDAPSAISLTGPTLSLEADDIYLNAPTIHLPGTITPPPECNC